MSSQVDGRQVLLDELLAELALHERVGRDLADVAALARELEEALAERRGQRVLAGSRARVHRAVLLAQRLVLLRDVRRVAHDRGVLAVEDIPRRGLVFEREDVARAPGRRPTGRRAAPARAAAAAGCAAASPRRPRGAAARARRPACRCPAFSRYARVSRKRAIATAYGLMSAPYTASSARAAARAGSRPGSARRRWSNRRSNAPSRKWPLPQVGSISVVSSRPKRSMAGSSVRSRMNDSTKSGVWSSA